MPSLRCVTVSVLGSGTSVGVPTIGCHCDVCRSNDPRDNRLRPSVLLSWEGHNVLIDTTPDFRQQALRAGIERLDAIFYTHAHADHIMGLDDVRPFNFRQRGAIPIYSTEETLASIRRVFAYIFDGLPTQSSMPRIETRLFTDEPFFVAGVEFIPIRLKHGHGTVYGFRFGSGAYLTDHSEIPEESQARLQGLDVLFLDALRYKPHPTHQTVQEALAYVEKLRPKQAFFTHISHDLAHSRTEAQLPPHVRLAYDGLQLTVSVEAS